jgi:hypothetical protein
MNDEKVPMTGSSSDLSGSLKTSTRSVITTGHSARINPASLVPQPGERLIHP